jgi:hypothetical protein
VGNEAGVADGNSTLRALLDEAGLSNTALVRAVVTAGAKEGERVGTNTTSVRRMLDGCQPRWPVPRLVAQVLSRKLHHEISVTDCGFADCVPVSEDFPDDLRCSGTLEGTLRTIVELSGQDMRRRKFLLGSAFSAAAFLSLRCSRSRCPQRRAPLAPGAGGWAWLMWRSSPSRSPSSASSIPLRLGAAA